MPPKPLEDIAREISKTEFIVFAGTGVTSGTGIPMWKELIRQLLQFVPDLSVDIEKISEEQYPEVAQSIYDTMVNDNHKDLYFDTIGNTLKPINAPYSTQQYDIWLTTNCVVTTNFEKTFCTAYQRKVETKNPNQDPNSPLINSLPNFDYVDILSIPRIIYLHGLIDERCVVFKTDDYENNYPSVSGKQVAPIYLENYLLHLYEKYTLVFVGFSFKDNYFLNALKNVNSRIKSSDKVYADKIGYRSKIDSIKHYAFLKDIDYGNNTFLLENIDNFITESENYRKARELFDIIQLDEDLESINIEVFRYKEHVDWTKAFEMIRSFRRRGQII